MSSDPTHPATLLRSGRWSDALASATRWVERSPTDAEAFESLALVNSHGGRHAAALEAARRAMQLAPGTATATVRCTESLRALGQLPAAVAAGDRAIALAPHDPMTWSGAGNARLQAGRAGDAVGLLTVAAALAPDNPVLTFNRANAVVASGDLHGAVEGWRRASALAPAFPQPHARLSDAFARMGRRNAAAHRARLRCALTPFARGADIALAKAIGIAAGRETYLRLMRRAVDHAPPATYALAALARYALTDDPGMVDRTDRDRVVHRLNLLRPDTLTFLEREEAAYASGNAALAWGRREEAYETLLAAKAMTHGRLGPGYDPEEMERQNEAVRRFFTRDVLRRHRLSTGPTRGPIFIVGLPKTGATMVYHHLCRVTGWPGLGEYSGLHAALEGVAWQVDRSGSSAPTMVDWGPEKIAELRSLYVAAHPAPVPDPWPAVWIDKQLGNFEHLGLAAILFPGLKVIDVVRDPADTCLSCLRSSFDDPLPAQYTATPAAFGRFSRLYRATMDHWRRVLPDDAVLGVPYEDLVARNADRRESAWDAVHRHVGSRDLRAPSGLRGDPVGLAGTIPALVEALGANGPRGR